MLTDSEYIIGLKQRDPKVCEDFVNKYSNRVYNTTFGILQNKEDAEEITQDVFIKVLDSLSNFDGNSSLGTWVYRIAVNKSLDELRKRKTRKFWSFLRISDDDVVRNEIPDMVHPEAVLEQGESVQMLFKALDLLPERQKTVIVLNKLENLPYAEIARVLELSVSAVDSLMSRAKVNLKKHLTELKYEG